MTDSHYDGNRKGSITKEKAVETFNKYYENRANSAIGRFRAKLFDMMYQKKPSKTLTPGQPGSERYLLEEGPRTFDMKGVDSFEEGSEFVIHGEDNTTKYKSKGSTYKKSTDNEDAEIYGPRLNNADKTLYSSHFKEVYQDRVFLEEDEKGSLNGKSLVEIYWDKYADGGIKRKNLKVTKQKTFSFIGFIDEKINYFLDLNDKIIYDESGIVLSEMDTENQLNFLTKLNLLDINEDDDYVLNKKFTSAKFLKIVTTLEDMSETYYYRLEDGVIVNRECDEDKNNISLYRLMELLDYELEDIVSVDIHNCQEDKSSIEDILEPERNLFERTINSKIRSNLQYDDDQDLEDYEEEEEDYEEEEEEEEDDEEEEEEDDEEEEEEDDEEEEDNDEDEEEEEEEDDEEEEENDDGEVKSMLGLDEEVSILDGLEFETDDDEEDDDTEEDEHSQDSNVGELLNKEQMEVFNKLPEDMKNEEGFQKELSALEL